MRVELTPAVILHQRHYRESSLLLEVFSREYGRISLVAKGARANKKKALALYQTHRSLSVSWSGKGEMGTLTEIEADGPPFVLTGKALMSVFYLNELLLRLLHRHESHPQLFDTYLMTLTRLAHGESELYSLRYFEKHLLDSIGYGLILDHELETGTAIDSKENYFYSINEGPYLHKPMSATGVEISGATLVSLATENLDTPDSAKQVRQLMRMTLNSYLGDKPLASRELFKAYSQQGPDKS